MTHVKENTMHKKKGYKKETAYGNEQVNKSDFQRRLKIHKNSPKNINSTNTKRDSKKSNPPRKRVLPILDLTPQGEQQPVLIESCMCWCCAVGGSVSVVCV